MAVAWPLAAGAQQPAMPVVGFLNAGSPNERVNLVAAFRQALSEAGMLRVETCQSSIVGRRTNTIGYLRWRLDLVHRQVAAIATPGSTPAAHLIGIGLFARTYALFEKAALHRVARQRKC
jgi:putative tryptophan/tyrosine transport system substrate-binding protein